MKNKKLSGISIILKGIKMFINVNILIDMYEKRLDIISIPKKRAMINK
ncbi:MAG: hypothetical protein PHD81_02395 [Candidatus Nanoarchaeia archaeon]|nr:hypothetical protein [Candidatus Nanoarchaeia archaeon]MDD5587936.1 hypothetical protein [Candidatus Nanoarchaeia archaeon]